MKFANCAEGEEHYKFGILEACADLHDLAIRGPNPAITSDEAREMRDWLLKRLEVWSWDAVATKYDILVCQLIRAVLAEFSDAFERQAGPA